MLDDATATLFTTFQLPYVGYGGAFLRDHILGQNLKVFFL